MTETAVRIILASRPVGEPTLDNLRLEELPIPQPGPGQMLLRTLWVFTRPLHARSDERRTVLRQAG